MQAVIVQDRTTTMLVKQLPRAVHYFIIFFYDTLVIKHTKNAKLSQLGKEIVQIRLLQSSWTYFHVIRQVIILQQLDGM